MVFGECSGSGLAKLTLGFCFAWLVSLLFGNLACNRFWRGYELGESFRFILGGIYPGLMLGFTLLGFLGLLYWQQTGKRRFPLLLALWVAAELIGLAVFLAFLGPAFFPPVSRLSA